MDKILIIEDDIGLSETTSELLRLEGFEVSTAQNGADGIQKAFVEHPDLIICDISMPELDGYQVHKTLQENSYTAVIPFIFLTAKVEKDDIRSGMLLGADDYITKPFDIEELILSVNTRLKKRKKSQKINEDQFRSIADNSPYGILICDEQYQPLYVNSSLQRQLNYSEDELKNMTLSDCFTAESGIIEEKLSLCNKGLQTVRIDCKANNKKGRIIPVQLICTGVKISGKPSLLINVINKEQYNKLLNGAENYEDIIKNAVKILTENSEFISSDLIKQLKEIFKHKNKHAKDDVVKFTKRELEVLSLVCKGHSNNEIADKLFISYRTVERHRTNLINKSNSKNIIEVIIYAIKNNLIDI